MKQTQPYKLICVSDSGVGRTSFIQRFVHNDFSNYSSPTIGVKISQKTIQLPNSPEQGVNLVVWDVPKQTYDVYIRNSSIVVLGFSLIDRNSFYNVMNWYQSCKAYLRDHESVKWVVIGCKIDLCDGVNGNKKRVVGKQEIDYLCKELGFNYFELSSKDGRGFNEFNEWVGENLEKLYNEDIKISEEFYEDVQKEVEEAKETSKGNPHPVCGEEKTNRLKNLCSKYSEKKLIKSINSNINYAKDNNDLLSKFSKFSKLFLKKEEEKIEDNFLDRFDNMLNEVDKMHK